MDKERKVIKNNIRELDAFKAETLATNSVSSSVSESRSDGGEIKGKDGISTSAFILKMAEKLSKHRKGPNIFQARSRSIVQPSSYLPYLPADSMESSLQLDSTEDGKMTVKQRLMQDLKPIREAQLKNRANQSSSMQRSPSETSGHDQSQSYIDNTSDFRESNRSRIQRIYSNTVSTN